MGENMETVKQGAKYAYGVWKIVIIVLLTLALVPLFIAGMRSRTFFSLWIMISLFVYLVLTYWHLRLKKGKMKEYLEDMATKLLFAMSSLVIAFLLTLVPIYSIASIFLVLGGILYAITIQNLFFLRVIGL
ncbi:hypothetical protein GOV07_05750 [Candidatus Woesearchaeota archaeon]|nr:hypothetical protein [Candidatus Woesearchaeota archaeon]